MSEQLSRSGVPGEAGTAPVPAFSDALGEWAKVGLLSFGGPTAQIALMHRVIVHERKWLGESQFLNALSFCMLLPGPEATQLATYVGWRLHGFAGGLAAGLLFVAPGALVVGTLAIVYALYGKVPLIEAMFYGIKAAVLVIVVEALLRIARRALKSTWAWVVAASSFLAVFLLHAPFPLVVLVAAIAGYLAETGEDRGAPLPRIPLRETLSTALVWLAVWWLPLAAVALVWGPDHVLSRLGLFFSKLAVVTFGGAYAVLAYMTETVVSTYGWLEPGQMLDGLGLAETTPGPLILVTEFVGFLAAYRNGGGVPMHMGLLGAAIALWATFVPCFLWIFIGAPYIEWLNSKPRLKGALAGITAAVVGVILNLALWFALHVFFAGVSETTLGPLHLLIPDVATLDWRMLGLAAMCAVLLLALHWGIPAVLAAAAAAALALRFSGL